MVLGRWLLLAFLLAAQVAAGQTVYRWVDANGDMHFTDDPATIPAKFRARATTVAGPELGVIHVKESPASPPAEPPAEAAPVVVSQPAPEPQDDEAAGRQVEQQWRDSFRAAHLRIDEIQAALKADQKRLETAVRRVDYDAQTGQTVETNEADLIRERIRHTELDLKQAQQDLTDLEREASRNSIPREWRR